MVEIQCRPGLFPGYAHLIFNATERAWIRFSLWSAQMEVCDALLTGRHLIVLKARLIGPDLALSGLCAVVDALSPGGGDSSFLQA